MSKGPFLRKYGVETTFLFDLFEVDGIDFRIDAVHASGDTKLMKDEGDEANTSNGFTDEGQGYSIVLDATEMQAARLKVYIVDSATKVWLDTSITIETYGNASAMHAFDLDTASTAQTGDSFARLGAAGASLTDLGGMSTGMKAEVESEVTDALVALGLDPLISTTIATVNSQTDFDLTADSGDDDTYVDGLAIFVDVSTAAQKSFRRILTHTTASKNIIIDAAPDFTIAATDKIHIFAAGVTPSDAVIADAVFDEALSGHTTAGTAGKLIGDMTYTKANELDVNTKSINDAEVVGDGNATPWDGV